MLTRHERIAARFDDRWGTVGTRGTAVGDGGSPDRGRRSPFVLGLIRVGCPLCRYDFGLTECELIQDGNDALFRCFRCGWVSRVNEAFLSGYFLSTALRWLDQYAEASA